MLAEEQAALRRVAELVARGAALEEVFAAVANEASKLLGEIATALLRYDPDEDGVVVAACNSPTPVGTRLSKGARRPYVDAGVTVPIAVEGRMWGALTASTPGTPLPVATDERLEQFAELAAAAIANAENKAKLTMSRARVVATADETRRRVQRDLHDGAQQRLVHTLLALGIAKAAAAGGRPAAELIDEAIHHAERANSELRDLVRGILPASLTRGGLRTAVESLVSEMPVPVDLDVTALRLPLESETTAYFIVAEALTNVIKHAKATRAIVEIRTEELALSIDVRDDGSGGADPAHGTGLTGLLDRVEASDGTPTATFPARRRSVQHCTSRCRLAISAPAPSPWPYRLDLGLALPPQPKEAEIMVACGWRPTRALAHRPGSSGAQLRPAAEADRSSRSPIRAMARVGVGVGAGRPDALRARRRSERWCVRRQRGRLPMASADAPKRPVVDPLRTGSLRQCKLQWRPTRSRSACRRPDLGVSGVGVKTPLRLAGEAALEASATESLERV